MVKQPAPTLGRPTAAPLLVDGVASNAVACINASSTWHWGDVPMRIEGGRSPAAIAHDLAMKTVSASATRWSLDGAPRRLSPAIDTTREHTTPTRTARNNRTTRLRPLRGLTGALPQPPPDQRLPCPEKLDKQRVIEGWASPTCARRHEDPRPGSRPRHRLPGPGRDGPSHGRSPRP